MPCTIVTGIWQVFTKPKCFTVYRWGKSLINYNASIPSRNTLDFVIFSFVLKQWNLDVLSKKKYSFWRPFFRNEYI